MLRYIYGNELEAHTKLRDTMYRDRADQFKKRLGWDVSVDQSGCERDEYDDLNPLYVIWERADGSHGGSMRFLPTTGQTMVNDHFSHLLGGGELRSPNVWECTRFCLSRDADPRTASALMLAGGEILTGFDLENFVGVFDARMVRIYRMIGASPEVLGSEGEGRDLTAVGLWSYTDEQRAQVLIRSGLSSELSRHWFDRAFGSTIKYAMTA